MVPQSGQGTIPLATELLAPTLELTLELTLGSIRVPQTEQKSESVEEWPLGQL